MRLRQVRYETQAPGPCNRAKPHRTGPDWSRLVQTGHGRTGHDGSWHASLGTTLHATLGTPLQCWIPTGTGTGTGTGTDGYEDVLWALNKECVTLKLSSRSILDGLSGFWLLFQPHVARTGLFQRPGTTYVYPIHVRLLQESGHYPNENHSPS